MTKRYFRHADGRVSTRTLAEVAGPFGFAVHAPDGVEEIPAEEGEKRVTAVEPQDPFTGVVTAAHVYGAVVEVGQKVVQVEGTSARAGSPTTRSRATSTWSTGSR